VTARIAALLLACTLPAGPLRAQVLQHLSLDAGVFRLHFRSAASGVGETLSGLAAVGRARFFVGSVSLETSYSQGHLVADTGTAIARDMVDGSAFLAVRPLSWLALKAGPHLRAYVAPGSTERWVMWEAHAHVDGSIIPGMLDANVEGWMAVGSAVNVDPGARGARGGQAGLILRLWRSPLWARLTYVVDQAKLKNDARTETVEAVLFAVGLGGR
jgi:hypothetical protein